jgi:hypothetical protein
MNRHEALYRKTSRALLILLGAWVTAMLVALALPAKLRNSDAAFVVFGSVFVALFVTAIVLSVVTLVSYIRWTGKYPYYFLFGKARGPGNGVSKGDEGSRPEKGSSASTTRG